MFDIMAASYMSATRLDHFLYQDIAHRNPEIARRLRERHGLIDMTYRKPRRARRPVLRPALSKLGSGALSSVGWIGHGLRRAGEAMERVSARSFQREIFAGRDCTEGTC